MSKLEGLEFRKVIPDHFDRFSKLYFDCFGIQVSADFFRWKYLDNPVGPVVAFEALSDGRVVAFYGVIPENYLVNGKIVKVYQSMDTMTHPQFQKRGLFTHLANLTFKSIFDLEAGLDLIGIPGGNSFHGFVHKLGWKNIHNFSFVFAHRSWFAPLHAIKRSLGLEAVEADALDSEIESYLKLKGLSKSAISPAITAAFFKWRVFDHPFRGCKVVKVRENGVMVGLCVYIIDSKKRAYIQWLNLLDSDALNRKRRTSTVLNHVFDKSSAPFVYTWKPLDPQLHDALRSCGFIYNPFKRGPFSYRVPLITRSISGTVDGADWSDIGLFDLQPIMQD